MKNLLIKSEVFGVLVRVNLVHRGLQIFPELVAFHVVEGAAFHQLLVDPVHFGENALAAGLALLVFVFQQFCLVAELVAV